MLFINTDGSYIEIFKSSYTTDKQYYKVLMKIYGFENKKNDNNPITHIKSSITKNSFSEYKKTRV
jgi:hypothetical protein